MLDTAHQIMDAAGDHMLRDASKATRFVLKKVPGAPAFAYSAVKAFPSDQPLRTAAGIGGGVAGGELGGLARAAAGGVNAPVGAVLGAAAGQDVADDIYDDFFRQHKAQMDATNRWIVQRRKDAFGR